MSIQVTKLTTLEISELSLRLQLGRLTLTLVAIRHTKLLESNQVIFLNLLPYKQQQLVQNNGFPKSN